MYRAIPKAQCCCVLLLLLLLLLCLPLAVLPFTPGGVSITSSSTKLGGSTLITCGHHTARSKQVGRQPKHTRHCRRRVAKRLPTGCHRQVRHVWAKEQQVMMDACLLA
jgi:hypothetical protein